MRKDERDRVCSASLVVSLKSLLGIPELVDGSSQGVVQVVGRGDQVGSGRKVRVFVLDVIFSVCVHLVRRLPVVAGHVVRQRLRLVESVLDLGCIDRKRIRSVVERQVDEQRARWATDWPWR